MMFVKQHTNSKDKIKSQEQNSLSKAISDLFDCSPFTPSHPIVFHLFHIVVHSFHHNKFVFESEKIERDYKTQNTTRNASLAVDCYSSS